jgi:hypothetical protein
LRLTAANRSASARAFAAAANNASTLSLLFVEGVDANPRGETNGRDDEDVTVDCVHFAVPTKACTFVTDDDVATTHEITKDETFMLNQDDTMYRSKSAQHKLASGKKF